MSDDADGSENMRDYADTPHYTFNWNELNEESDYMDFADISQNPFNYEGFVHYAGSDHNEDYGQVHLVEMR